MINLLEIENSKPKNKYICKSLITFKIIMYEKN